MFIDFKKEVKNNFDKLAKNDYLFYVGIGRDAIWEEYLNGFEDADFKQQHNCNCCKSFLRQWGGIVAIVDNKVVSIWDNLNVGDDYKKCVENLKNYIHSLPITEVFYNKFKNCGTDNNITAEGKKWNHFYIELPNKFIQKTGIDTTRSKRRDNKNLLKRALEEITTDAVDTTLELIGQNSLYRGAEFKAAVEGFQTVQDAYSLAENKDNFCWTKSVELGALCRIRNSAIGTLLVNLSEDMELDTAVSKYEKVVAPHNYKRPTALVTPRMVEDAKEKLEEMGLMESIDRRYAMPTDVSAENVLYMDKSSEANDVAKRGIFESIHKVIRGLNQNI